MGSFVIYMFRPSKLLKSVSWIQAARIEDGAESELFTCSKYTIFYFIVGPME